MSPQALRDVLTAFFSINDAIVQFVHGQVFLVLGVTLALQWRQRSALDLSRALPWIAAFGVLEAIATWGNSFIPIQQQLLAASTIQVLRLLQLFAHIMTFAALLAFGLRLNRPRAPAPAVWALPLGVLVGGLAAAGLAHAQMPADPEGVNATLEAVLRYVICAPAALLVAYGLREQASRLVGPLKADRVVASLRVAGFGFLFYALVEGLVVPLAPGLWPVLPNERSLYLLTGIPVGVFRAAAGTVILVSFFRALEVFRLEADRASLALRQQQSLVAERERISRDLHDGTIQSIYAAGMMLEGVKIRLNDNPDSVGQIDAVVSLLNRTIEDVRSYIYNLRAGSADEDLARGMLDIVAEFRMRTGVNTEWRSEGQPQWTLGPELRQHVYQIAREALSNIARHAHADEVVVELRYGDTLQLRISDNGAGSLPPVAMAGRGLRNMRERARLLGAELAVTGEPGRGTWIELTVCQS